MSFEDCITCIQAIHKGQEHRLIRNSAVRLQESLGHHENFDDLLRLAKLHEHVDVRRRASCQHQIKPKVCSHQDLKNSPKCKCELLMANESKETPEIRSPGSLFHSVRTSKVTMVWSGYCDFSKAGIMSFPSIPWRTIVLRSQQESERKEERNTRRVAFTVAYAWSSNYQRNLKINSKSRFLPYS